MKSNFLKETLYRLLAAFFWILVWWVAALIVGNGYFLPSPVDTVLALFSLLSEAEFYTVVLFSILRVLCGLGLGVAVGSLLAAASHHLPFVRRLVCPVISVFKAMPVATFIIILWITLRGSLLSIFIGFMMVMPIIFQNLLDGYDSIDKTLLEVTRAYEFSAFKRFRLLTLPTLLAFFAPALITSIGLAFKSQIAAEIIAYTNESIGQYIFDSKYNGQHDKVFAWALVIVTVSILLEYLTKKLLWRFKNES